MTVKLALVLALAIPAAAALAIALLRRWPNIREAATLTAGVLLLADVLYLAREIGAGGAADVELIEVFPGLPLAFSLEPLGLLFALIASGLWIVTSVYSIGYMRARNETSQTRFYVYFAIAISAALGVAFSANVLTLFVFYEMLTLSTYPLVTHHRTEDARKAGRIYLGILISTSVTFLLGKQGRIRLIHTGGEFHTEQQAGKDACLYDPQQCAAEFAAIDEAIAVLSAEG